MDEHLRHTIERLLASHRPEELTIFYIDPLDRPDLAPLVNEAIALVVGFGKWVIPPLLQQLDASDLKAQIAIANALGRLGADAVPLLLHEYQTAADAARRQFVIYALGKIKSPRVAQAIAPALEAAAAQDRELRDTATRTLGKFAEALPLGSLADETRQLVVHVLQKNLGDQSPAIRAKAVRSLGKFAKYGHLTPEERGSLQRTFTLILGKDERFEWDRAYLVRKEAAEALAYL
jgi:hypothetical protein